MSRHQQQKLHQQQQQQQQLLAQQQQQILAENAAAAEAAELFDLFCVATTMRQILGLHRNMCDLVGLRPAPLNEFYPKLKAKVRSWKAQALWKKFDARAAHRVYGKGTACTGTRVLVIGAGPCGLRAAIEAQLLGAKVVVLEKRDRITRNNVLHLWPFVITDLRNLGAKKFYGKFCAGSIDHISIRQLQCMLLKVALLLGVEIHEGVSFEDTIEPTGDGCGWRASVLPADHPVSHYEFDVLVGADGKRNMLGFRRKEFRGKLAIAITANFINKKTEAEAKVEEISGVAFIFNQSFFKELYQRTGIDLENIVYYKDETHYFVMTAKKHSLIDKGVIIEDMADPAELLAPANVDTEKLHDYAREAAEFSTQYQMPNLEFAVNHYGKPDVAMFDFTSMFAAEMSCRVRVRKGFRLLQCLVGDSLLEPFWPTGSGCARGFLSSMDAGYAIKLWANPQNSILGVLAQRESIYRLLGQTTPDTLQRDISAYTVDPATRYPNLNRESVNMWQVKHLCDTDDPSILEQTFMDTNALLAPQAETPGRRKRRSGDSLPQGATLLRWITAQLHSYDFTRELKEPSEVFTNGRVLCALINRYRPDLVDFNAVKELSSIECNELAFEILEKELHIERIMKAKDSLELTNIESRIWLQYLAQICEAFRGEIPHVKHAKMDFSDLREKYRINHTHAQPDFSKLLQTKPKTGKTPMQDIVDVPQNVQRRSVLDEERVKRQRRHEQLIGSGAAGTTAASASGISVQQTQTDTPRRSKKRRSAEKSTNIEERQQRLKEIEENRHDRMSKRRQQRYHQTQNFYKSLQMLQAGNLLRESDDATPFEDYSIFLYRQQAPVFNDRVKELERKLLYPDRERSDIPSALPRGATDEQFSDRIKNMEQRITARANYGTDKKPKDLMRAIGKIDSNDWNVREIEKKIEQSKKTEIHGPKGREKVPKWSKEQFMARQNKMSKPQRQDSHEEEKFREIDQTLKNLDKQLKEGRILEVGERGRNKVASIAGQFVKKDDTTSDEKQQTTTNTVVPKSSSKVALAFKKQAASEKCRFCKQTVYLMEKITVEGLILHRGCLKCHHCHTNLRLGGYAFDRDDPNGRFYCTQHFRLPAKPVPRAMPKGRKSAQAAQAVAATTTVETTDSSKPRLEPKQISDNADLLDNARSPSAARAASADAMSDDEANIIDEHEWSGRNFLPESNNDSESDLSSSDESDTESESDIYEEADDSPFGAQTLQLATDWIGKQHYADSDDSDDFYDSSDGIADDGKDDTDGEEFKKARELRREEVRLLPLPANLPTDTETEVQSESETTSPDEVELNSATEISTDSEFDNDEVIRQTPKIYIDDTHLRKLTKVQIKSSVITPSVGTQKNHNHHAHHHHHTASNAVKSGGSYLAKYQVQPPMPQFKPLVQVDPTLLTNNRGPLQNPRPGDYLLNKTASTEGIASKKSLELKKRYLLGEAANGNKIQKSGSTSVLDSRIRSFQSNISECQKLLNPSSDISASMKTFLDRTKLGENSTNASTAGNELMRSATSSILNDLKVEIKIQKAPSSISTDNEKENVFVNSKNELNKGMEYSETVNTVLLENLSKKSPTTTPTNNKAVIECINLVTPEKQTPIINLTDVEIPKKMVESNVEFINNIKVASDEIEDSNKIIDLTVDSPIKSSDKLVETKPDVSKDVKECIPDILGHIKRAAKTDATNSSNVSDERERLLSNSDEEKRDDSPEKVEDPYENDTVQIQVPNIPWNKHKSAHMSNTTTSGSGSTSCTSSTSSIEDIQHYILESTTSPDTQTAAVIGKQHNVPRVEIHDTSGTLMQVDSLMIIDGKYIGDPEDVKYLDMPEGVVVPEVAEIKTSEVEDEHEMDVEPVTATPEPAECTVIETKEPLTSLPAQAPPLPESGPPSIKKFDTKNENKIESLKNLPLIVEQSETQTTKAVKPVTLNLSTLQKTPDTPTTPKAHTPGTPLNDNDKTPTADLLSRGSDSETEATGTGQVLTETELSDWTADDCISENFIDMEFVLNSNKGTIKRNRKERKKLGSAKMPSSSDVLHEVARTAPVAEFEGILKSINIDDIEFMDTGSEGSCAEAYSATNTALLRNRGYMEFIESAPKQAAKVQIPANSVEHKKSVTTKRDEKLGVDYIEQGAYIMREEANDVDLLKTPVNESPPHLSAGVSGIEKISQTQSTSAMTQSLTDSSTLNDMDDDSISQAQFNSLTKTTTEESEALTVVTSPLDTSSPRLLDHLTQTGKGNETAGGSTPSSSEKQPKTSQSTCTHSSASNTSSRGTPPRQQSTKELPPNEDLSYEEYVRALQQKITQISTARDSLDSRKHRRKSSKSEPPNIAISQSNNQPTVIDSTSNKSQTDAQTDTATINTTQSTQMPTVASPQVTKVPEIPTLTRKLEEITKERTKQKDLIHDLVMDKLQSKKQLNAEKRLHRSRQRSLMTSGYASGSSLSPTPKLAAAATTNDANCTNQAHYHVSTAEERPSSNRVTITTKENNPLQKSATYVSPYRADGSPYKQRPFSEHFDAEQIDTFKSYKLNKTPSFSYATKSTPKDTTAAYTVFAMPIAPLRQHRARAAQAVDSNGKIETNISTSTENLRLEARARARLKSNSELGLSPEEKMQLLRKRLQTEHNVVPKCNKPEYNMNALGGERTRKISTSKSVNDLAYMAASQQQGSVSTSIPSGMDFTSDPNLLLSATQEKETNKVLKTKPSRRQKDPERRKSLIQSLSNFFHKSSNSSSSTTSSNHNSRDKKELCSNAAVATTNTSAGAANSAQPEQRPGTSGSGTTTSNSSDGVFSLFRISPRSKEKSKDKDEQLRRSATTTPTKLSSSSPSSPPPPMRPTTSTQERCNSHDYLNKSNTNSNKSNTTNNSSSNNNNKNHNNNKNINNIRKNCTIGSGTTNTFSASSPQLYVHKPSNYMAPSTNAANDDQLPPPIPPLPLNYQRSDDESYANETREHKKQRAISKATRQAELKRLRIAQEIQREQEEIEVQIKELEARGVLIEKALRGESQNFENLESTKDSDEKLLKELLEIWRNITQLKKRDEELGIRQQELQLEHRHAQLKEELNMRLSCNKLDKSSADVAAEGAILNEMLEIVAKRAALRPTASNLDLTAAGSSGVGDAGAITITARGGQPHDNGESNI